MGKRREMGGNGNGNGNGGETPALSNVRESVAATKAFVERYQDRVLELFAGDESRKRRFMQTFATSLAMEPKLAECTRSSLLGGVLEIATLGLEPGVLGQAWLIPFRNKGTLEAQVVIGYRGLMELARRSGMVGAIEHSVVRAGDHFEWQKGTDSFLHYRPGNGDTGERVAAWACADLKGFKRGQFEVMSAKEIEAIKERSPAARSGHSPWQTDEDAMWAKTVIRKLCKFLPVSSEMQRAITLDEQLDSGVSQQLRSRATDLADVPVLNESSYQEPPEPPAS